MPQSPDITMAYLVTGVKPNRRMHRDSLHTGWMHHPRHFLQQHEWQNIPQRVVQRLITSRHGGHNRYRHFAHPYVTPLCMFHVDSQRYCFRHVQSNPCHMGSSSLVACIMSTSFVIKLWKSMQFSIFFKEHIYKLRDKFWKLMQNGLGNNKMYYL